MKFCSSRYLSGWLILLAFAALASAAPIGKWSFDETSGTSAADGSGNGLSFTLFGSPSWTAGHNGGALEFNGTTTYGQVSDSPLLDGTDMLTISFWVKPTGLDGNPQFVLSKRTSPLQNAAYGIFFGAGNKLNVDLNLNSGSGNRFESQTVFQNDQWYDVKLVFDGSAHASQRARLYINGTLDRDASQSSASIPDKASPLFIGIGQTGYAYKFKGLLDDLSIAREVPSEVDLAAAHQGLWTLEKWSNMPYKEVNDLLADPRYHQLAGSREVLREAGKNLNWYQAGGRFRGQIKVPASGRYVFWLSARTAADLYLSEDGLPFNKRRIAHMSPAAGTGNGIRSTETNLWDQFATQMSEPIELEAGTKYYIEIIGQVSLGDLPQMRLAWAPENGVRTEIPASALSYYVIPDADRDDDSLPDAWEISFGLDPADNGGTDLARQGENGDYDRDGLTNREEYLLGTDPTDADTDGDGRSDYDEVRTFRSNPVASDAPQETVVGNINLENFVAGDDSWLLLDGGLIPQTFRGEIEWDFSVPSAGTWLVQALTKLRGTVYDNESLDVVVWIDGKKLGRYTVSYANGGEGLLRIVTPALASGTHRLKLEIDNVVARRTVQIVSVDIRQPGGADDNANGQPDWIESLVAQTDFAAGHGVYSRDRKSVV